MTTDGVEPTGSTAPVPTPTPEQVARVAALIRPHIPAILAARAAREAAAKQAERAS